MVSRTDSVMTWIHWLASPRWAVAFFLLAAAGSLAVVYEWSGGTAAMLIPLTLLVVNLATSIVVHRRFRADIPLLLFHLALVALVALFVMARLTYLEGVVTVMKDASFSGKLQQAEHGPLHDLAGLQTAQFTNLGFTDQYRDDGRFVTRNRVGWQTPDGFAEAEIGTDTPLVAGHYRIYTSHHRGLAAIFEWQPETGEARHGSVEFAIQPDGFSHGSSWQLPGGIELWATLDIPRLPPRKPGSRVDDLWAPS
jgi:cytochrome c biogenesis protein